MRSGLVYQDRRRLVMTIVEGAGSRVTLENRDTRYIVFITLKRREDEREIR